MTVIYLIVAGVKPGTIVVTSESLNTELKPIYELVSSH